MSFEYCDGACDTLNLMGSSVVFSPRRNTDPKRPEGYAIQGTFNHFGITRVVEFEKLHNAVAFALEHAYG